MSEENKLFMDGKCASRPEYDMSDVQANLNDVFTYVDIYNGYYFKCPDCGCIKEGNMALYDNCNGTYSCKVCYRDIKKEDLNKFIFES